MKKYLGSTGCEENAGKMICGAEISNEKLDEALNFLLDSLVRLQHNFYRHAEDIIWTFLISEATGRSRFVFFALTDIGAYTHDRVSCSLSSSPHPELIAEVIMEQCAVESKQLANTSGITRQLGKQKWMPY